MRRDRDHDLLSATHMPRPRLAAGEPGRSVDVTALDWLQAASVEGVVPFSGMHNGLPAS